MAKGLIDRLIDSIFDEKWIGRRGEKLTERELKLVNLLGRKGKILRNVYIPKDNGETSEIDVVYITQKGIFVFESKNYSGWIFGDESGMNWTVMLPNKVKNKFYNPIKQNRTHIKWLSKYVGEQIPLFSIIVFSERCELKKVTVASPDIKVIKRDRTYAAVREIWEQQEDVISAEEVEALYEKLKNQTNVSEETKKIHVSNIEEKYKQKKVDVSENQDKKTQEKADNIVDDEKKLFVDEQNNEKIEEKENQMVCPRCGKELVLRTAKKGKNAGNQFYGCSGFPKCRYIRE